MSFGLSAGAVALIGGGLSAVGGIAGGLLQANGAQQAANTQAAAAQQGMGAINQATSQGASAVNQATQSGIGVQQQALGQENGYFNQGQQGYQPYMQQGQQALNQQMGLMSGAGIQEFQNSPMFQGMLQQGQNSILQNAAATGGLRGGNVQAAVSQYSPQLLNQMIQQQFSNLGSISGMGENAAGMSGNLYGQQAQMGQQNAGAQSALYGQQGQSLAGLYGQQGQSIADLYKQQGQAQAGGQLGQAAGYSQAANGLLSGIMGYSALNNLYGGNGQPAAGSPQYPMGASPTGGYYGSRNQ